MMDSPAELSSFQPINPDGTAGKGTRGGQDRDRFDSAIATRPPAATHTSDFLAVGCGVFRGPMSALSIRGAVRIVNVDRGAATFVCSVTNTPGARHGLKT